MGTERAGRLNTQQVATIASGGSLSGAIDLTDYALAAIVLPSGWDAAAITFAACATSAGTFGPVFGDDGTEVTIAAANVVADRVIVNKSILEQLAGLRFVKIRSGTSGAAVNQTADRTFKVMLKA